MFIVAIVSSIRLLAPQSIAPEGSFLMYFGGVMIAAWFGGLGPGLLATALSTIAVDYLLEPPQFSVGLFESPNIWRALLFILECVLISVLAELLHHARRRAERSEELNRKLETEILAVSDAEKRRIGHDLHDGLGQHLTGLSFMSKALAQRLSQANSELATDAARIAELSNKSIAWTRDLAHGLQPVAVDDNGLHAAIETLCGEVSRQSGVDCRFESDSSEEPIPAEIATNLYRIAQESITNSLKHAAARHIRVSLIMLSRSLTLTIEDDGRGIDAQRAARALNPGLGLQIMQYRARMIGGTLEVGPSEAGGTAVVCNVQLPALEGKRST